MKFHLSELAAEPWAMEPKALEALFSKLDRAEQADPKAFFGEGPAPKRPAMQVKDGIARIPVSGVLLKQVPSWLRRFGVDATAYRDIEEDLDAAVADEAVEQIVLAIDSPGGQVAGVQEAGDAIYAAANEKPVRVEVGDLCASAAYWLASQADHIAAGLNAQIGSIGVYSVYVDSSRAHENAGVKVHVVSSGPQKGAGVPGSAITQAQLDGFQKVIDGMAANFKAAVARGRDRMDDSWATGAVWLAADAAGMGLIDHLLNPKKGKGAAGVRPATQQSSAKEMTMDPITQERKRVAEIKAAFPRHPQFALAHAEKGSTLAEAQAAFIPVLEKEAAEAKAAQVAAEQGKAEVEVKLAEAQKRPVPAPGAAPVPVGAQPSESPKHAFEVAVEEHMKLANCSQTEAMSYVCGKNPKLYRAWSREVGEKVAAAREAIGK